MRYLIYCLNVLRHNEICSYFTLDPSEYIANLKSPYFCRYEWSAGLTEESEPHGIFDSGERIWHDAAPSSSIYFTIKPGTV